MRAYFVLAVCAGLAGHALGQTFEPMPHGAKSVSAASDFSKFLVASNGQGEVYVSTSYRIWTRSTPAVVAALPGLPATHNSLVGYAMSHDGTVVAGSARAVSSNTDHAMRLVLGGSWQDLGAAPGDSVSRALALSGDGSIAGGDTGPVGNSAALLWTSGGGSVELTPPYTSDNGGLRAISADGLVMAGVAIDTGGPTWTAWYWTSSGGYTMIPLNAGERAPSIKLSRNGAWVACTVGSTPAPTSPNKAFIWSPSGGREDLPLPGGAAGLSVGGVSDDGSVVACESVADFGTDPRPCVWRRDVGYLRLEDALRRNLPSSTFDGWMVLGGLTGVSADGTVVVGEATHAPNGWVGKRTGWLSVLPPVCPADLGSSGGLMGGDQALDNNDFIAFIELFFAQDPLADRGVSGGVAGHDGQWDNNDFIVFISQFFAGC